MKPALTHLLAAALGAALVFLVLKPGDPRSPKDEARQPSKSGPPITSRLPAGGDQKAASAEDDDYEAFNRKHGAFKPTRAQLEDYIAARNGDPEAIMAAGLILGDVALLKEALEKDPNNPHLLSALIGRATGTQEEMLEWRRRFVESDPENAIARYLLAAHLLESGDAQGALEHLRSASTLPSFQDYSLHNLLATEEAFRGTGSSALGAKLQSTFALATPHSSELGQLANSLLEQGDSYSPEDLSEIRNITAGLGTRMTNDLPFDSLVADAIGVGMQAVAVRGLPDDAPSPFEDLSAGEANASLRARSQEIREISTSFPDNDVFTNLPPETIDGFLSRSRQLGEGEAIQWLNRQVDTGQ